MTIYELDVAPLPSDPSRARNEDLVRPSGRRDACGDVDRKPADPAAVVQTFAGVEAATDANAQRLER